MTNPIPLFPLLDDPALDEIKWDAQLRLEEIERWLYWQGSLSRSELAEKFRMSKQQTSAILKQYQQLHPT
ncbi:MarR family transcriptional regulator, partial [Thiomicrospira microaerophila]|uniref:MarR family transcriptional regulator n=1 Tax=Thiomicrospira microaerophila TaxID=406020 RepID=UPI0005C84A6F